jgi:GntR family transcriptional regulator, transcriptional repressor for pyruvate dehydrogenase complex
LTSFQPLKQSRLSEGVTEQLKHSILTGGFEPGTKLPSERALSEQFQVSRLSIREAIHRLEILGFVEKRSGSSGGVYVIDLTFQYLTNGFSDLFLAGKVSVPELRQLRIFIEPEVAKLAALAITAEHVQKLREYYAAEESHPGDPVKNFERRAGVHYALAHMCGNRFYEAIVRSTLQLTFEVLTIVDIDHENFEFLHPTASHGPIVDAVIAGNAKQAHDAMRQHAIDFGEVLLRLDETYRRKSMDPVSRARA